MSDYVYFVESGNAAQEYEEKMVVFSTKQKALDYCYTLMHNDQVKNIVATDCIKDGWVLSTYEDNLIVWKTERTAKYVSLMTQILL